jgi:hypothetical protein
MTFDHQGATRLAVAYVVEVLGLLEFELRVERYRSINGGRQVQSTAG